MTSHADLAGFSSSYMSLPLFANTDLNMALHYFSQSMNDLRLLAEVPMIIVQGMKGLDKFYPNASQLGSLPKPNVWLGIYSRTVVGEADAEKYLIAPYDAQPELSLIENWTDGRAASAFMNLRHAMLSTAVFNVEMLERNLTTSIRSLRKSSLLSKQDATEIEEDRLSLWLSLKEACRARVFRNAFAHAGGVIDEVAYRRLEEIETGTAQRIGSILTLSPKSTLQMINELTVYAAEYLVLVNQRILLKKTDT